MSVAQPLFCGVQLGGAILDILFQGLVDLSELLLGVFPDGDVVSDADEAAMLAGRPPARLRFRAQPPPGAVSAPVASLEHERPERRLLLALLAYDAIQIIRMERVAPIIVHRLFERQSEKVLIGGVDERTLAVELAHP